MRSIERNEKILVFYRLITNAYKEEDEQTTVRPLELGEAATDDFIALIYACFAVFQLMTQEDCDIIDFSHIVNKLVVQDLLENKDLRIEDK